MQKQDLPFLSRISALVTDRVVPKKKVLDNDWETFASSIIDLFFQRNCIHVSCLFQFLKIWPTLVGSCTLWKTSKRAIPLSPLVLPNNRFLLWKTISHSSKCLYTLTFVCSYLFQTIKREIYTWVSIKVSHNGAKINIKCHCIRFD